MKKNKKREKSEENILSDQDLSASGKFRVTIMLDEETLKKFRAFAKAGGGKYQTLINECLKETTDSFLTRRQKAVAELDLKRA